MCICFQVDIHSLAQMKNKEILHLMHKWSFSISLLLLKEIDVFHWLDSDAIVMMREYLLGRCDDSSTIRR